MRRRPVVIPPEFDYCRASSVEDALELLEVHADADPVVLAGGHGLLPDMKTGETSPGVLIDVSEIDGLRGVEGGDSNRPFSIGALTTHATLAESDALWEHAPVLAEAAKNVGDLQVRNRGTIGGNLVEADPAADLPAAAVAADATLALRDDDGERTVSADEFFGEDGTTSLGNRELLTEIRIPNSERTHGAYAKKTHPATGYALVGVAVSLTVEDGTVTRARLAASGVAESPVRLTVVEDALVGSEATQQGLSAAAENASATLDPSDARSDPTASGEFRIHLLEPYAERALTTALDRTIGDGETADGTDAEVTTDE
ncbi:FAD binding domain-containing protein [Halorussus halophilus]|uniref:FAD binding domain-containing protein n=1 Tax=Halorussus halophilus TaxID=2650975 RepID=UPI001CE4ADB9|nr:xanthine dehydrogenase family protein subunit M [Halorussus halophilus]